MVEGNTTFLPIDHVSGSVDVTNVVKGAGAIELALERNSTQWYCAEGFVDPESENGTRSCVDANARIGDTHNVLSHVRK
ncbi:hypothetical protein HY480_03485 [Candidatus Uhrbacteria bacterium]|nr:hypothetical protein [Candidatus Uhrbacteria bacterium]